MSSSVETEEITKGQIEKLQTLLGSALKKSGLKKKPLQYVIKEQGKLLMKELLEVVRHRVEAISNFIWRNANVDRSRMPELVIEKTGRVQYVDKAVLATMPNGTGNKKKMTFFKANKFISPDDLAVMYKDLVLKPDPYAQAAVNEADPEFADKYPNCTQWKDENGTWCYLSFVRYNGERGVVVRRDDDDDDWSGSWWFGGVPQD